MLEYCELKEESNGALDVNLSGHIDMQNVTMRYKKGLAPALKECSFNI